MISTHPPPVAFFAAMLHNQTLVVPARNPGTKGGEGVVGIVVPSRTYTHRGGGIEHSAAVCSTQTGKEEKEEGKRQQKRRNS